MSNTGWAVVVAALIIILGGGWWLISGQAPAATDTAVDAGTNAAGTMQEGSEAPSSGMVGGDADVSGMQTAGTVVHYGASGFAQRSVTIKAGEKVTFVNDGTAPMWIASAEHPTHTVYDGSDRAAHCSGTYSGPTPFDQCQPGPTYTFVFAKAGTFEYHNHSAAQFEGTVVVQ